MEEWGIFDDDGLLEGGFRSELSAELQAEDLAAEYQYEDLYIALVCGSCRENEAEFCECEEN